MEIAPKIQENKTKNSNDNHTIIKTTTAPATTTATVAGSENPFYRPKHIFFTTKKLSLKITGIVYRYNSKV